MSSHREILSDILVDHQEAPLIFNTPDACLKILGMMWDPRTDSFRFQSSPFTGAVTKRTVLSYIARIYDPMGFLSPITFSMKWFLQQLWLLKINWDEELDLNFKTTWLEFCSELCHLSSIHISRFIGPYNNDTVIIGFSDDSERGYSSTLYLYTVSNDLSHTSLLASKTKVAPPNH